MRGNDLPQQEFCTGIGLFAHNSTMNILPIVDEFRKIRGSSNPNARDTLLFQLIPMMLKQCTQCEGTNIVSCSLNVDTWDQFRNVEEHNMSNVPGNVANLCFVGDVFDDLLKRFSRLVSSSVVFHQLPDSLPYVFACCFHPLLTLTVPFRTTFGEVCVKGAQNFAWSTIFTPTPCPSRRRSTFQEMIAPSGDFGSCLVNLCSIDSGMHSTSSAFVSNNVRTLRSCSGHGNAPRHFVSVKWKICLNGSTFVLITQLRI